MQHIYLDNAATTRLREEVLQAMLPYLTEQYGNPSSSYGFADMSRKAVGKAREEVARLIGADSGEIYFTSGGSESDNWALKSVAENNVAKGRHIITTAIEHHAILHTCQYLERNGFEVTCLGVDRYGKVSPDDVRKAIRKDTVLVSVMAANNEIGTIQPIAEIGEIAHEYGALFHTDAVQAFGHIPIDVKAMHIDLLSASGHKLNGPKGIGILYASQSAALSSFMHGGGQERGLRAGTLNVPGIVGMGRAAALAREEMAVHVRDITAMRNYLIDSLVNDIPGVSLNGHPTDRLPNNVNISFRDIDSRSLLVLLDQHGICASNGSACSSSSDTSHVIQAVCHDPSLARGVIRLTLSHETSREQIDYTVQVLKTIIKKLTS